MKYDHSFNNRKCCSICAELACAEDSRLAVQLATDGIRRAAVCDTQHFTVIPSLGPLVLGHSLLVTRSHEKSILLYASAAMWRDEILPTLRAFSARVLNQDRNLGLVLFEHGSTARGAHLCSTDHAHLHIVPMPIETIARLEKVLQADCELIGISHLEARCRSARDFVYTLRYGAGRIAEHAHFRPAHDLESQHMRRVIAGVLGIDSWNWKDDANVPLLKQTIDQFFRARSNATPEIRVQ